MKRLTLVCVLCCAVSMTAVIGTASAFEGGGRMPSEAPLIGFGEHLSGALNNRADDSNYTSSSYESGYEVAFWHLPPLATHDLLVVNWHELPKAHESSFPICLALVQGVDDYNWGAGFHQIVGYGCSTERNPFAISGSGTSQTAITIPNADTSSYLEFFARGGVTESSRFETFPYDFAVEPPRHFLTVTLPSAPKVASNAVLGATVLSATGQPAPDGLAFTLTATWSNGGVFQEAEPTVGGRLSFPLALPESALGQRVRFVVGRAADASFQGAESPAFTAEVPKPPPPPNPAKSAACRKATAAAKTLGRRHHRLQAHSSRARARARRKLHHLAHQAGRDWNIAKKAATAACT